MLTVENFKELFPRCEDPDGWVDAMNEVFPKYEYRYTSNGLHHLLHSVVMSLVDGEHSQRT